MFILSQLLCYVKHGALCFPGRGLPKCWLSGAYAGVA